MPPLYIGFDKIVGGPLGGPQRMETTYEGKLVEAPAAWGAILSMALCVAVLIASEFMPVSLLVPIATDLGITEGQTGQAISISGVFAVFTSLFVSGLTRGFDRRLVLTSFSVVLIVSGVIVTLAPNYAVLMVGRALLGIAIGGFWSMSTAIVMRLVPAEAVPRGLAMINAGNAIAATISAPLGSLLGDYIGWRGAFFFVVPLALLALVWQWLSLPELPPSEAKSRGMCSGFSHGRKSRSAWVQSSCSLPASSPCSPICARFSRTSPE